MTRDSPGFRRMMQRLGPDAAEKLRLDTVRLQQEALKQVSKKVNTRCWSCGAEHDRSTSLHVDGTPPQDGDISMCYKCGALAIFDGTYAEGMRKPSPKEKDELLERYDVFQALLLWKMTQ